MKRLISTLRAGGMALALAAGLALPTIATAAPSSSSPVTEDTDGILITLDEDASADARALSVDGVQLLAQPQVLSELDQAGITVSDSYEQDNGSVVLEADGDGLTDEQALTQASQVEGVASVQYNYVYHLIDMAEDGAVGSAQNGTGIQTLANIPVNDPYAQISSPSAADNQYWLYNANLDDAWAMAHSDNSVTIAVLDSGIDLDHEDLAANILTDLAFDATLDRPLADCTVEDSAGHGTMVAGIAAAVANNDTGIAGASYNASVLPIKVVDNVDRQITSADLVQAYNYLFDLVDSGKLDDLCVINMSLGGYFDSEANDEAFHDVIKRALFDYDVLTVCAGGNGNQMTTPNTGMMYPADYDECISVTALEPDGTNIVWSDYNQYKDISAPGRNTPSPSMHPRYHPATPTSPPPPIVSGTAALLCAAAPDATPEEVREALLNTATEIQDSKHDRTETSGSRGALDAGAAVEYLVDEAEPSPIELPFTDVDHDAWYYGSVVYAYQNGIMHGKDGENGIKIFDPNTPIERQDAAVVLYNILGAGEKASPCALLDVDQNRYYADAVNWAVDQGYFHGYLDEETQSYQYFGVGNPLTREELATVVANIARNEEPLGDVAKFNSMPDHGLASPWAQDNLIWAINRGVINGVDQNGTRYLNPLGATSRAEMAAIMMNCLENGVVEKN